MILLHSSWFLEILHYNYYLDDWSCFFVFLDRGCLNFTGVRHLTPYPSPSCLLVCFFFFFPSHSKCKHGYLVIWCAFQIGSKIKIFLNITCQKKKKRSADPSLQNMSIYKAQITKSDIKSVWKKWQLVLVSSLLFPLGLSIRSLLYLKC